MLCRRAFARVGILGEIMESIIRPDGTKLRIEFYDGKEEKTIYILSGVGYTTDCPLLYYQKNLGIQYGYKIVSIDFDYMRNEHFVKMDDEHGERYYKDDIKRIIEILNINTTNKRIFIGKSMGTTVISRLIEMGKIRRPDSVMMLTPGNEWEKTIDNLKESEISCLVIASKNDKRYAIEKLTEVYEIKNIEVFELEKEDHCLEIMDIENDIDVLKKVMKRSEEFIKGNSA